MIEETIGNFQSPIKQNPTNLEYHIPIYLESLKNWLGARTEKQVRSFVYYLDGAFQRADQLDLMKREDFRRWYQEYTQERARAINLFPNLQTF